jgi:hypothetical protein
LTTSQKDLLSKGFKFVPSRRKVDIGKLIADIKTWERRMRLREYFFDDKLKIKIKIKNTLNLKNHLTGHQIPDVTVGLICM